MLAVAPYSLYAQDAAGDDSQAEQRKPASARKVYETRVVSGVVVDAATNRPLAGALVSATGIDGYSVLTGDDVFQLPHQFPLTSCLVLLYLFC